MKRQLNFWSKMRGLPDKDLIHTSLSVEGNKFVVRFGRPGSAEPIDQIEIDLSDEEALQLKHAFELAGAQVFHDEMDERIYLGNIARSRDISEHNQNIASCLFYSIISFFICIIGCALLIKLPGYPESFNPTLFIGLSISFLISILLGVFLRKTLYKDKQ